MFGVIVMFCLSVYIGGGQSECDGLIVESPAPEQRGERIQEEEFRETVSLPDSFFVLFLALALITSGVHVRIIDIAQEGTDGHTVRVRDDGLDVAVNFLVVFSVMFCPRRTDTVRAQFAERLVKLLQADVQEHACGRAIAHLLRFVVLVFI